MKLILYFIFLIISTKESKIEIIELSNYESKEIKFTKSKNYHIFKFNYNPIPNVNYTSCTIRLNPPNKIYNYFIYDNAGDIFEENGFFKHYTNKNTKLDSQVGVILLEKRNKDFYIVLQYNIHYYLMLECFLVIHFIILMKLFFMIIIIYKI